MCRLHAKHILATVRSFRALVVKSTKEQVLKATFLNICLLIDSWSGSLLSILLEVELSLVTYNRFSKFCLELLALYFLQNPGFAITFMWRPETVGKADKNVVTWDQSRKAVNATWFLADLDNQPAIQVGWGYFFIFHKQKLIWFLNVR